MIERVSVDMTYLSAVLDLSEITSPLSAGSLSQNFMSHLPILTTYNFPCWCRNKLKEKQFRKISLMFLSPHKQWIMLTSTLARRHFISFLFFRPRLE